MGKENICVHDLLYLLAFKYTSGFEVHETHPMKSYMGEELTSFPSVSLCRIGIWVSVLSQKRTLSRWA